MFESKSRESRKRKIADREMTDESFGVNLPGSVLTIDRAVLCEYEL
jgi:hypothetical protein